MKFHCSNIQASSWHPKIFSLLVTYIEKKMRGGDRGLRGRSFEVLHISSGSPSGVLATHNGMLEFKNGEDYFFVTSDDTICGEKEYEFSVGLQDSIPGYGEVLRIIDCKEVIL